MLRVWLPVCLAVAVLGASPVGARLVVADDTLDSVEKIVGGSVARGVYVRHLARLHLRFSNQKRSTCTATIVGRRWLLTAAHCAYRTDGTLRRPSYAYVGETDATLRSFNSIVRLYPIRAVYVHTNHSAGTNDHRNDISLVELKHRIGAHKYAPVRLLPQPRDGAAVMAVGYGRINGDGTRAKRLMHANMTVGEFKACKKDTDSGISAYLDSRKQLCAGGKTGLVDTCIGDSGGPLFKLYSTGWAQIALTSFGPLICGKESNKKGFYTKVEPYRGAIRRLVEEGLRGPWKRIL